MSKISTVQDTEVGGEREARKKISVNNIQSAGCKQYLELNRSRQIPGLQYSRRSRTGEEMRGVRDRVKNFDSSRHGSRW